MLKLLTTKILAKLLIVGIIGKKKSFLSLWMMEILELVGKTES